MRFGVCCGLADIAKMEAIGFDYIEGNATVLFQMEPHVFRETVRQVRDAGIRPEAFNCLFPAQRKVLLAPEQERGYLDAVLERMALLGGRLVVFGSGYARERPADMAPEQAWSRLVRLCRLLADRAQAFGLEAVIEPLNRAETSMVNTQEEARRLAAEVAHPSFGLLADFYHMQAVGDGALALSADGSRLRHAHIAAPDSRACPRDGDGVVYSPFFEGLKAAGYNGRLSFEGHAAADEAYPALLAFLRRHTAPAG